MKNTGLLIVVIVILVVAGFLVYNQNQLAYRLDEQQKASAAALAEQKRQSAVALAEAEAVAAKALEEAQKPRFEHRSDVLASGEAIVQPAQPRVIPIVADTSVMRDIAITGRFTASGGTDNAIEAFVFDQDNYVNWINSSPSRALYQSGTVAVGAINLPLRQTGKYYLVFSGKRNIVGRRINADLKLDYEKQIN
jgi:hypothetical protein